MTGPCQACGTDITLQANIEGESDVAAIQRVNAHGVGLYRSEFLYLGRSDLPSEDEHYQSYRKIVQLLKGAPLTIRTVDLGADKRSANHLADLVPEANPALGLRGVRRCIHEPNMFLPQLRAILRVASQGPVNILLPMLTQVEEVIHVQQMLAAMRQALRSEGQQYAEHVPVGGMIEVPASAISAAQFARHLDFFAIGTNDLTQYTLALDRTDDR